MLEMQPSSIFCVLQLVWFAFVGLGIIKHQGLPHGYLPLALYDSILRTYGPVLPFIPLLLRAFIQRWFGRKEGEDKNRKGQRKLSTDTFEAFKVYCMITTIRWMLYALHLILASFLKRLDLEDWHLVSDHIVLGASMATIFQLEISVVLSDKKMQMEWMMELIVLLNLILFLLTCGDMFYTALYFHSRMDCVVALLQGMLLQFGGYYWLLL